MSRARAEELLAWRAVDGLEVREGRELSGLLTEMPELDDGSFERAAAACHLALLGPEDPLPANVRRRLERAAEEFRAQLPGKVPTMPQRADASPAASAQRSAWGGWLAAAACLVLAVVGWWPRLQAPATDQAPPALAEQQPSPPPELAPDAIELPWQATEDDAALAAGGSVVWSSTRQAGFMRIRGLEANDPAVSQYQLWIFDKNRDERFPVDGGVFDMPAGAAEAIVPIDAKVAVDEPVLFAVTVERPGGVVVSDRERIVLLAQRQA